MLIKAILRTKMTAFWDIEPCVLVEVGVSEVLTAYIIRAMTLYPRRLP
jgi:hypothetical protein